MEAIVELHLYGVVRTGPAKGATNEEVVVAEGLDSALHDSDSFRDCVRRNRWLPTRPSHPWALLATNLVRPRMLAAWPAGRSAKMRARSMPSMALARDAQFGTTLITPA